MRGPFVQNMVNSSIRSLISDANHKDFYYMIIKIQEKTKNRCKHKLYQRAIYLLVFTSN